MIRSEIINTDYSKVETSGIVISFFSDLQPSFVKCIDTDELFYKPIEPMIDHGDFQGNFGEADWAYTNSSNGPKRIFMLGLGRKEEFSINKLIQLSAQLAKVIQKFQLKEFSTVIHGKNLDIPVEDLAEAIVTGTKLGLYQFQKNISLKEKKLFRIERVRLIEPDTNTFKKAQNGVKKAEIVSGGVYNTRDIVNLPSNIVTPDYISQRALELEKNGNIECRILKEAEILELGMNGLHSVGRASCNRPVFVDLRYKGAGNDRPIVLIGKGLTFDSGGISLKDSKGMYRMKSDMAGSAVVLYAIKIASELGLKVNITGLLPLCENLISECSMKPGDVIKAMNGLNVEVVDTDAEGRLVLMDALCYGEKLQPHLMIDIATLTGAITVALGRHAIGSVSNSQELIDLLIDSGEEVNERIWQLPLWEGYKRQLESPVADIRNYGGPEAGAITAGAFLSNFVKSTPWVHLDIAGVTWLDFETALSLKGASGTGVRLFVKFFENFIKRNRPLFKIGGRM